MEDTDYKLKYNIVHDITDEMIAHIYFNGTKYRAELIQKSGDIPVLFGFPTAGTRPDPPSAAIEAFLKDRVIPENRDMLNYILRRNGVYEYDWRHLITLNIGRTTYDPYRVETVA